MVFPTKSATWQTIRLLHWRLHSCLNNLCPRSPGSRTRLSRQSEIQTCVSMIQTCLSMIQTSFSMIDILFHDTDIQDVTSLSVLNIFAKEFVYVARHWSHLLQSHWFLTQRSICSTWKYLLKQELFLLFLLPPCLLDFKP